MESEYLSWLSEQTETDWWADTGNADEIMNAAALGAVGVTTNPVLINQAIMLNKSNWRAEIKEVLDNLNGISKAEALTGIVVKKVAEQLCHIYKNTKGASGYVCSQVNPAHANERDAMYKSALNMSAFAENVSVKLPATAAGFDVMEECISTGINVTMTVSFTLPQVLETARRYKAAKLRAQSMGKKPGGCNAVIMIGRIDDYIRDVALDIKADVEEKDIICAGLSIVKRAYSIYKVEKYEPVLMVAAMRGTYHITELAGSGMILSIAPAYQKLMANGTIEKIKGIENPVNQSSVRKLQEIREFVKAYEPDGMKVSDFYSFGAEQRTLTQFFGMGWSMLEKFEL